MKRKFWKLKRFCWIDLRKCKKREIREISLLFLNHGAQGGTRTHTISLSEDFESSASTISPPGQVIIFYAIF